MQVFTSGEFGDIRIVQDDDRLLFCGSDVAKALGYARPNEAVAKHCRGTLKRRTPTTSGIQHNLARIPTPLRWWEELRLANSPPLWYNQC